MRPPEQPRPMLHRRRVEDWVQADDCFRTQPTSTHRGYPKPSIWRPARMGDACRPADARVS